MMVGNNGECRQDDKYTGKLVASQDAVKLAKANGVSKYIEIFSNDENHVSEIFKQAVLAINQQLKNANIEERKQKHLQEETFFRSLLTVPKPEGQFDQLEKTFELNTNNGNFIILLYIKTKMNRC